eukprot:TRINITY_DN16661_c0_g1_i1.p1 TRINITY_DN16661_c0_g1~~TRINITY_DN16661_c0_g1_i1.p1  ORF type:complete len:777 (-),score=138.53 TRINITY_DN16661_c0_g1_i1:147-2417(-)
MMIRGVSGALLLIVVNFADATSHESSTCFENDGSSLLQHDATVFRVPSKSLQPGGGPAGSPRNDTVPDQAEMLMGVTSNAKGDLHAFLNNLLTNIALTLGVSVAFSALRQYYPIVYSNNIEKGLAPIVPANTFLGWVGTGFKADIGETAKCLGLDSALMLEFINLALKILAVVSVPSMLMLLPLHMIFGGGADEVDRLSRTGMANVVKGHPWLYYVHGLVVLGTCVAIKHYVYQAQETFLDRRFRWLKGLHGTRARTVLIEGIPQKWRSEQRIRHFFLAAFDTNWVESVFVVKKTGDLESYVAKKDAAMAERRKAEFHLEQHGGERPTHRPLYVDAQVDSIDTCARISEERKRLLDESNDPEGVNCASAFVTFKDEKHAEIAKELDYFPDPDEFVVSMAPESSTVRWWNLRESFEVAQAQQIIGRILIIGLYVAFIPACLGTTNIANAINLGPTFAAMAPSFGLTIWMSFFPTVLLFIINTFFNMSSSHLAQERLLVWYFWFQVIFVVLVTAIGNDVVLFVRQVAMDPINLASIMSDQLPKASHFYMNYLVIQWSTNFLNLLRYMNLSKYLTARAAGYGEEEAKNISEPEAQDYYGFGARSARWTIKLMIGIVFSTLSPAVSLIAFLDFVSCKVVFGYLITVAETKKPDMGGHFWVDNLKHALLGGLLYSILMAGVLFDRAPNSIPGLVATGAILFMATSLYNFQRVFRWEALPYNEVMNKHPESFSVADNAPEGKHFDNDCYQQPELRDVDSSTS